MAEELSDRLDAVKAGEGAAEQSEIIFSAAAAADVVSAEAVKRVYDHYVGVLAKYDSGQIQMDSLNANKIRSNTRTVSLILERIKTEDRRAAQRRLRRAETLMQELMQEEGRREFILYAGPDPSYN